MDELPRIRVNLHARVWDPILRKGRHCWSINLEQWDPNVVYAEIVKLFEGLAKADQARRAAAAEEEQVDGDAERRTNRALSGPGGTDRGE
jgi:hypothetical protein